MMKQLFNVQNILLTLYLMGSSIIVKAQAFDWAKAMGGSAGDYGYSVTADGNGNVYVTGQFNSDTADFNPGGSGGILFNAGSKSADGFLAKYDGAGNFLWARDMGGNSADDGKDVAVDDSGNVYVTGYFQSATADFNPGGSGGTLNTAGGYDGFLAKYDANGNFLWAKDIGGKSADQCLGIAVDNSSNVYVTGYFNSSADFNPGGNSDTLTSAGGQDVFLAKYDGAGNFLWAKNMGGIKGDLGQDVAVDGSDNVYVTGYFLSAPADFNPGGNGGSLTSAGGYDVFLAKYNGAGDFLWAKNMGGSKTDYGYGVATDDSDNVYIAGQSNSIPADFNLGGNGGTLTNTGGMDGFLATYDSAGNFRWAKDIGGRSSEVGYDIAVGSSSNIYLTGYSNSPTIDFNPGGSNGTLTTAGSNDVFIAKYDAAGNFRWAKDMGGSSGDFGYSVAVDEFGQLYGTGFFTATATFDSTSGVQLTAVGSNDIYLVKLSDYAACANGSSFSETACHNYSFGSINYTTSGTYRDTLTNAHGCDSIVTLYLTVIDTVWNTITDTTCDSYMLNGKTYTASGSYNQVYTSAEGCDSILTLNLTINKSYYQTDTQTACDRYVFLGETLTQSGIYSDTFTTVTGCDSIFTLKLTVHHSSDTTLTVEACDNYTLNDSVYTISGTYTQILPNSSGCDSTITLQLTIGSSPVAAVVQTGTTLTANSADGYQWLDCDNNYAPIAGATEQTFTPDHTGNYAVLITAGSCSDTSDCYTVKMAGSSIDELVRNNKIKLYPNPTTGKVTIKAQQALQNANIRLVNVMGQVLTGQAKQSGKQFELNMAPYASGIYFVEIIESGKIMRLELVKE